MAAAVGIWLGLSGAIAVLVGLTGLRRVRGCAGVVTGILGP